MTICVICMHAAFRNGSDHTVTCYNIDACLKIRLCCNEKSFVGVGNDFYNANRVKYLQKI